MQIKRDENIRLADGRSATLSTVRLPDGGYETMLFTNDPAMEEITVHRCADESDALYWFDQIKRMYHTPELTGRYKKLAEDLKAAIAYGLARMGNDDGGTSNFDSPTLYLPGWKEELVEIAARAAGTACSIWKPGRTAFFVFAVPGAGQGYTRTKVAEAIRDHLEGLGYDAGMYYQMD